MPAATLSDHLHIIGKSFIVLSSWICGYYGMKYLPLTIVAPINATRPVMVLVGAFLVFGERLNGWQWLGVALAVTSFLMLSRSGRQEGIDFRHNRWIALIVLASLLGAVSGLYDRYLMAPPTHGGAGIDHNLVQSWYNIYQCVMMAIMAAIMWWPKRHTTALFRWHWGIPLISIFLSAADYVYFLALAQPDAMISVVSMVRRGSVVVSFIFGALLLKEKNLKAKTLDLLLVLLGML